MAQIKIVREQKDKYEYKLQLEGYDVSLFNILKNTINVIKNDVSKGSIVYKESAYRFQDPIIVYPLREMLKKYNIDIVSIPEIDKYISNTLQKNSIDRTIVRDIKEKTDNDYVFDTIKGELFKFQKVAVEFLDAINGDGLLSFCPGAGKTLITLAYITKNRIPKTLVVSPASVKYSWESEVNRWTYYSSAVIESKTNISSNIKKKNIWIINYDILDKFREEILAWGPDIMVLDESQYIKNPDAKRSRAVKFLSTIINKRLFLSGTPVMNKQWELFTTLNIFNPLEFDNFYEFTSKYSGGHFNRFNQWECKKNTNVEELRGKISDYIFRKSREEILPDLPPKIYTTIPLILDSSIKKEYDDLNAKIQKIKQLSELLPEGSLEAKNMKQKADGLITTLRIMVDNYKVDVAYEKIQEIIEAGEKIVVFSKFTGENSGLKVIEKKIIKDYGYESFVTLTADTSETDRKVAVKKFQEDPNCLIFLGGIGASSTGITLTASSNMLFISKDWGPSLQDQAESRIHRISQNAESVNIYSVVANGTIDEAIEQVLISKQEGINSLLDKI